MPDRISIDIEGLREQLEVLAAKEERKLTQMIRVLVKEALEARKPILHDSSEAAAFLKLLTNGQQPTDAQIVELAQVTHISKEKLMELRDRLFPN